MLLLLTTSLTCAVRLQVLNSASIEVRKDWVAMRTKIYLNYLKWKQWQFNLLVVHALIHLLTDCTMKKDLALLQVVCTIMFKRLYQRELKSKLELPYCDDSFLKTSDSLDRSSDHSTNELKGKNAD